MPESELLLAALDYAKKKIPVFPLNHPIEHIAGHFICSCGNVKCQSQAKHPKLSGGFYQATTNEETIREWWRKWPHANIGIPTGEKSGYDVIDLDTEEAEKKLAELTDLSTAPIALTGRGKQVFFAHTKSTLTIGTAACDVKGFDWRCNSGYIVAPPSRHISGKKYQWIKPLSLIIPFLPDSVINFIGQTNAEKESLNLQHTIVGLPEGKRDDSIFKFACLLRQRNLDYNSALAICEAVAAKCQPPFTEAKQKVDQAWKYPPGASANGAEPLPEFWPMPLTMAEFIALDIDTGNWLWQNVLPYGEVGMIAGEPRAGKTTLALNLSVAVARGVPFLNRSTVQSSSLYISLDNSARDMKLLVKKLGITDSDQIHVHIGQIPARATDWLLEMIVKLSSKLIVIDTLERFYSKQDINKPEMAQAMVALDLEIKKLDASLLYIHHATAKPSKDARIGSLFMGHTTVKGMTPYYFELVRVGEARHRILRTDLRSGENIEDMFVKQSTENNWIFEHGTIQDAYLEEAASKIKTTLAQNQGLTLKELLDLIEMRRQIVSVALNKLVENGDIQRTGSGKRGDPFHHHLV